MTGPGDYEPDPLTGIIDPEKLPKPKIKSISRLRKKCPCPLCDRPATRHGVRTRTLHHLGNLDSERPIDVRLTFSTHYCCQCKKKFHVDTSDIVAPRAEYTNAVVELAVRLVVEDQLPFRRANAHLWRNYRVLVPYKTIANRVDDAGKKNQKKSKPTSIFIWHWKTIPGIFRLTKCTTKKIAFFFSTTPGPRID